LPKIWINHANSVGWGSIQAHGLPQQLDQSRQFRRGASFRRTGGVQKGKELNDFLNLENSLNSDISLENRSGLLQMEV
jgi:hypothetical protein